MKPYIPCSLTGFLKNTCCARPVTETCLVIINKNYKIRLNFLALVSSLGQWSTNGFMEGELFVSQKYQLFYRHQRASPCRTVETLASQVTILESSGRASSFETLGWTCRTYPFCRTQRSLHGPFRIPLLASSKTDTSHK